jgi:hypothetical protein
VIYFTNLWENNSESITGAVAMNVFIYFAFSVADKEYGTDTVMLYIHIYRSYGTRRR